MRERAIESSGNKGITIDDVAAAALREGTEGQRIRLSIDKLAKEEDAWLRNTPPHILKTGKVMQTREAELHTFAAINAAVVATIELEENASAGDKRATEYLHTKYVAAYAAIDKTPGSTAERRNLSDLLSSQAQQMSTDSAYVLSELQRADRAYIESAKANILSKFIQLDRSDDLDL